MTHSCVLCDIQKCERDVLVLATLTFLVINKREKCVLITYGKCSVKIKYVQGQRKVKYMYILRRLVVVPLC